MGVHGLTSFIDDHSHLLLDHELRDTKLVIDGSNIYHFIHFNHKVTDTYGGDYDVFAQRIRQVFGVFQTCGIEPYVVFDGAYARDDRKLDTVINRARKKIFTSDSVSRGHHGKLLPLMAYDTFIHVLNELNVRHLTCDLEADDQIVLLANEYNCPVLSGDSDFYIFDVHGGYIPMDYLAFDAVKSSDKTYSYMPCQYYHVDNFVESFEGLTKSNLPLAATVLGNDFIDRDSFERFLAKLNMPKNLQKCSHNQRYHKLLKLFYWLASLDNPENAQEEIVKFLGQNQQTKMRELMQLSVDGYRNMTSDFDLRNFFEKGDNFDGPTLLKGYNGTEIPPWLIAKVRKGELPVFLTNIVTLHSVFLPCQVEHTQSPSAFVCSNKIRAVLYGILLKDELEAIRDKEAASKRHTMVEEYNRNIKSCQKSFLEPCFELPVFGPLPGLTGLPFVDKGACEMLLYESLCLEKAALAWLSPELTMYVACIIVWVREAKPKATSNHLKSLLVCLVYLYVKQRTGMTVEMEPSDIKYELDMEFAWTSSSEKQLQGLKTNLAKYALQPVHNHKNVINSTVIHGFAQFQTCLLMTKYLNKLLGRPFVDPNPEKFFCGTFLYNLCKNLLSRPLPDLFISEMLLKGSPFLKLFHDLEELIMSNLPPEEMPVQTHQPSCKRKKGSKREKSKEKLEICEDRAMVDAKTDMDTKRGKVVYEAACDLHNRFAFFTVEDHCDSG